MYCRCANTEEKCDYQPSPSKHLLEKLDGAALQQKITYVGQRIQICQLERDMNVKYALVAYLSMPNLCSAKKTKATSPHVDVVSGKLDRHNYSA